jgi:hypothetical protein
MGKYHTTINTSYMTQNNSRKKMVGFLKLGSCRVLVGRKNSNTVFRRRHKILFIFTAVILIIGLLFIIF